MKCPHCLVSFHDVWSPLQPRLYDSKVGWILESTSCPSCMRIIIRITRTDPQGHYHYETHYVVPESIARSPLPPEVVEEFRSDYLEACAVLPHSEKASAALSRRCLQHLLRAKAGVKHSDLADEIQQVLVSSSYRRIWRKRSHARHNESAVAKCDSLCRSARRRRDFPPRCRG